MHIYSLSLSLALICWTGRVQSQSCYEDWECKYKCCKSGTCADTPTGACPCRVDSECKSNEICSTGSCCLQIYRLRTTTAFSFPSQRPYTFGTRQCYWNSDCSSSEVCRRGHCEYNYGKSGGGFTWTGSRVLGIVLFVVIGTIVSCLYHLCKRARKPPVLAPRNRNVSAPPTGVAVGRIEREARVETSSTHVTVVEVEDHSPLPPDGPPPYNSLQFESRQNGYEDPPEQPPPSYDEAVKNSGTAPV